MWWTLEMHRSIGNRSQSADNTPIDDVSNTQYNNKPPPGHALPLRRPRSPKGGLGLGTNPLRSIESGTRTRTIPPRSIESGTRTRTNPLRSIESGTRTRTNPPRSIESGTRTRTNPPRSIVAFGTDPPKLTVSVHLHAALVRYGGRTADPPWLITMSYE